jgi:phage repressor protein C with HTH and peptisase S24 domain
MANNLSIGNLPAGSGAILPTGEYRRMKNQIRKLRRAKDITLETLAETTGISLSHLSRMESGTRGVSLEQVIRIARALQVEPGDVSSEFSADDLEKAAAMPLGTKTRDGDIPNLNIHAGMGPGGLLSVTKNEAGEIYSDQSDGFWSFPDAVKAGWRNRPHVYAMPVTGDSMEPTLRNGSFVFVDTTHTVPSPEDIYALDYGDGLMIKRLKMVPRSDKILVMSDNERYGTDELLREDVTVYGRVVAWFQWRG